MFCTPTKHAVVIFKVVIEPMSLEQFSSSRIEIMESIALVLDVEQSSIFVSATSRLHADSVDARKLRRSNSTAIVMQARITVPESQAHVLAAQIENSISAGALEPWLKVKLGLDLVVIFDGNAGDSITIQMGNGPVTDWSVLKPKPPPVVEYQKEEEDLFSTKMIVAIACGGFAILIVLLCSVLYCRKQSRRSERKIDELNKMVLEMKQRMDEQDRSIMARLGRLGQSVRNLPGIRSIFGRGKRNWGKLRNAHRATVAMKNTVAPAGPRISAAVKTGRGATGARITAPKKNENFHRGSMVEYVETLPKFTHGGAPTLKRHNTVERMEAEVYLGEESKVENIPKLQRKDTLERMEEEVKAITKKSAPSFEDLK